MIEQCALDSLVRFLDGYGPGRNVFVSSKFKTRKSYHSQGWVVHEHLAVALSYYVKYIRPTAANAKEDKFAFLNTRGKRICDSDWNKNLSSAVFRFGGEALHATRAFSTTALRVLNDTKASESASQGVHLDTFRRSDMHSSEVAERHYNKQNSVVVAERGYQEYKKFAGDHSSEIFEMVQMAQKDVTTPSVDLVANCKRKRNEAFPPNKQRKSSVE